MKYIDINNLIRAYFTNQLVDRRDKEAVLSEFRRLHIRLIVWSLGFCVLFLIILLVARVLDSIAVGVFLTIYQRAWLLKKYLEWFSLLEL